MENDVRLGNALVVSPVLYHLDVHPWFAVAVRAFQADSASTVLERFGSTASCPPEQSAGSGPIGLRHLRNPYFRVICFAASILKTACASSLLPVLFRS